MFLDSAAVEQILTNHGYTCEGSLAKGGYACVYKVRNNKYGIDSIFVAKAMYTDPEHGEAKKAAYDAEVSTLIKLIHPNILNIYDHFMESSYCFLILEYCENNSLEEYLRTKGPLSKDDLKRFILPIIDALQYLHEHGISHSDLKPSNILLDSYFRPKLADFGLAQICRIVPNEDDNYDKNDKEKGLKIHWLGSRPYMAPELFKHVPYDPMVADIWSLGITIYHLTVGSLPWNPNDYRIVPDLISSGLFNVPKELDLDIAKALRKLCVVQPYKRLSLENLKQMPVFASKLAGHGYSVGSPNSKSSNINFEKIERAGRRRSITSYESNENIQMTKSRNEIRQVMSGLLQLNQFSKNQPGLTFA